MLDGVDAQARGGTLILGGGFAGSYVAKLLKQQGATIVSPENFMLFASMLPEAASGTLEPRHVVVTGIGHARNLAVVASGDAVIAVGGSWGTLAEIGFGSRLGRRVVVLEPGWEIEGVERAATPAEAVELALADLG